MELADVIVALGGDRTNTVPKHKVTPAEIAVLMTIHGNEAVFDVRPLAEEVERTVVQERERLFSLYPARDDDGKSIVLNVYPGVTPIMHTTLEDLQLPEEAYAPMTRVAPKKSDKPAKKAKATAQKPPPVAELAATGAVTNSADSLFDE